MISSPPDHRYVFLDGLRGIAALSVVIFHLTQHSGHGTSPASAAIAVDLFFCLSGFVIAYSYHEKLIGGMSKVLYVKKRIARLYPMYLIGLVLGVSALSLKKIHGLADYTWESIATASVLNLFYLPYFNTRHVRVFLDDIHGAVFPVNDPSWSLFFELVVNFLYALTIGFSRAVPLAWLVVSGVGLLFATVVYGETPGWGTANFIGGFPRAFFLFFAGVVIFQLPEKTRLIPAIKPAYLVALVILLLAMPPFEALRFYWLGAVIALVPLIVAAGSRCSIEKHNFWHKTCAYFGRLSYPVYCVHFPLLLYISTIFRDANNFALIILASFAITLFLTHIVMKHVEEPFRSRFTAWLVKT